MRDIGRLEAKVSVLLLVGVVLIAAGLYVPLLSSEVGHSGDTAQFQFVGHLPGLPHAPGAPVYVLSNHIFWRLLPFFSPALVANLQAMLAALATLVVLFVILRRCAIGTLAATLAVLSLAISSLFWRHAVVAGLYLPALLMTTLSIERLLLWRRSGRQRDLLLAAAAAALGLGIHPIGITAIPAWLVLMFPGDREPVRRAHFWRAAMLAGGLLVMECAVVVALALDPETPFVWAQLTTPRDFLDFFTAASLRADVPAVSVEQALTRELPGYVLSLVRSLGWLTPLAIVGLVVPRHRSLHRLGILLLLGNLVYVLADPCSEAGEPLLQGVLAMTIFLALGLDNLAGWLSARMSRSVTRAAISIAVLAVLIIQSAERRPLVAYQVLDSYWAERALSRLEAVAADALIVSPTWAESTPLLYYLFLPENPFPGVDLVQAPTVESVLGYLRGEEAISITFERRRLSPGRRVFVIGERIADELSRRGCHLYDLDHDLYLVQLDHDPASPSVREGVPVAHRAPDDLWISYGDGWGPPESWGRWALAPEVTLQVENLPARAVFRLRASLWEESGPLQLLRVMMDGVEVGVISLRGEPWQPASHELPLHNPKPVARARFTLRFAERWPAGSGRQRCLRSLAVQDIAIDRTSR